MEWLKNLSNAIEYIESHLDTDISYEEAARIACCSTYYFQRLFSYVAGISLSEYIRKRRMSQAAFELQRTDKKVLDVAFEYGYTSPTAFNRAFQSVHGITPAAAKNQGITLNAYPPISFSVSVTGGNAMSYHIVNKPISLILPNEVVYETVMNAIVLPVFFLSTALFPANEIDGVLGTIINLNPFTHVINALRSLILYGYIGCDELFFVIILFTFMAGSSFVWALHRLKKETAL